MFSSHGATLNKWLAALNTVVLIFSSLTMALAVDAAQKGNRTRLLQCLGLTFLMACTFMGVKTVEYRQKFMHWTIVATDSSKQTFVYDGHVLSKGDEAWKLHGIRLAEPDKFDIHTFSPAGEAATAARQAEKIEEAEYEIPVSSIVDKVWYGPQKNNFYASYFTLTGVHGLHVLGGMIPILLLGIQAWRGKIFPAHTEYVGLYWHFVDLVWIFLFPLLYLI